MKKMARLKRVEGEPLNYRELISAKYLHGDDWEGDLELTIDGYEKMKMYSNEVKEKIEKSVIHWREDYKPMILTNVKIKALKKLFGDVDAWEWVGKKVILYTVRSKHFGEMMDVITIRPVGYELKTKKQLPILNEKSDKWQGAVDGLKAGTVDLQTIMQYYKVGKKELIILKDIKKDEQKN